MRTVYNDLYMFPLHDPLDDATRDALSRYDDLTAALLARRGIKTAEEAEAFLNPSYDENLHDPLLMTDMPLAAKRLGAAILSGERIAVWSDYDSDGIPGAVVLHDFLQKVGANFENHIPHRHDDGYGLNVTGIETLAAQDTKLIVTVDAGTTDFIAIARAKEFDIDVIVTDHHLPAVASGEGGPVLPDASAIVNPNARPDEMYPFHELCGAAVAWKLVCGTLATEPTLRERVPVGWEKWLLDMVGIATIADMVPLIGENRVLAAYGLLVLRKSPRKGIRALCRTMRVDQRSLTEDDIGFMVAPRVNAASRMGDARVAFDLFTATREDEADRLAGLLEQANRERKAQAGALTRAVRARLKERDAVRTVIAMGDPTWRPALLGLIAGTIADEYGRPVFLWGRDGNGNIKGSARNGGTAHVLELMNATESTFVQCGGHAAAGGFTVRDDAVFFLEDRLVLALKSLGERGEASSSDTFTTHADAEISPEEVASSFMKKIERLAPFGIKNPKPVFLLHGATVDRISRFGKGKEHVKVTLSRPGNERLDAVHFFANGALANRVGALAPGRRADILAHMERDLFSGNGRLRLRLIDIKPAS